MLLYINYNVYNLKSDVFLKLQYKPTPQVNNNIITVKLFFFFFNKNINIYVYKNK